VYWLWEAGGCCLRWRRCLGWPGSGLVPSSSRRGPPLVYLSPDTEPPVFLAALMVSIVAGGVEVVMRRGATVLVPRCMRSDCQEGSSLIVSEGCEPLSPVSGAAPCLPLSSLCAPWEGAEA